MESEIRSQIQDLDKKREALEIEGMGIISELTTPNDRDATMGIDTPLVDEEGYPRDDIDIQRASTLRSRLSVIRTDHKDLKSQLEVLLIQLTKARDPIRFEKETMAELEKRRSEKPKPKFDHTTGKWVVRNWDGTVAGVPNGDQRKFDELHDGDNDNISNTIVSAQAPSHGEDSTNDPRVLVEPSESSSPNNPGIPFARISYVAPNSPAAMACLEEGDMVLQFGDIDHTNHHNLSAIGELVQRSALHQEEVDVQIMRDSSVMFVKLNPSPWKGNGLLGCLIVPC
jgi:Nas2 N_terminal domain